MGIVKFFANNSKANSLANRLRRKRFDFFLSLSEGIARPIRILDIGGTVRFWQQMGFANQSGVTITILNLQAVELDHNLAVEGGTKFKLELGDARAMPQFANNEFDIVFSNSVLEHVGSGADQKMMIDEALRVGQRFFIQTPNFYFPIEPHFHVLGFQFLPIAIRVWLLQHFDLGWTKKVRDPIAASKVVSSVVLLSRRELVELCPVAQLYLEKSLGLTKSFILYGGWDSSEKSTAGLKSAA